MYFFSPFRSHASSKTTRHGRGICIKNRYVNIFDKKTPSIITRSNRRHYFHNRDDLLLYRCVLESLPSGSRFSGRLRTLVLLSYWPSGRSVCGQHSFIHYVYICIFIYIFTSILTFTRYGKYAVESGPLSCLRSTDQKRQYLSSSRSFRT